MKKYDWRQCAVLSSNDAYGTGASSAFLNEASSASISVTAVAYFSPSDTDFGAALDAVKNSKAKIIVLAALGGGGGRLVLKQALKKGMLGPKSGYTWILSEASASTALLLLPGDTGQEFGVTNAEFRAALLGTLATRPRGGSGALWDSLIQKWASSTDSPETPGAPSTSVITNDVYVPYSVDAVYTVAHAFRSLVNQSIPVTNLEMKKALAKTAFMGVTGWVVFDSNFDRSVPYNLLNMQDSEALFERVGEWAINPSTNRPELTVSRTIVWPGGTTDVPSDGLPRTLFWVKWNSAASISILVFVGIAILLCLITIFFIAKLSDTPIMRLASPWFLITTLVGLALFFSSLVPWMGRPNPASCALRNWLGHVGFCLAIAAIIAKTYRVDVIFRRRKKIKRIVVTNLELLKYVAIIMAPIIILLVVWTIVDRPKPSNSLDSGNNRINVVCGSKSPAWLIAAFVYDAFLMALSLFLSFRTRRVPDGFNETWYIYLSGYNTIVMGILGVTLGYVLQKNLLALTIIVSVTLLVGGLVIWALLFLPKLYIGLIVPDRNTSMLRSSRTAGRGGASQYSTAASPRGTELAAWHSSNINSSGGVHTSDAEYNTKTTDEDTKNSKASKASSNGSKRETTPKQERRKKDKNRVAADTANGAAAEPAPFKKSPLAIGAGMDSDDDSEAPSSSAVAKTDAVAATSPSKPKRKKKAAANGTKPARREKAPVVEQRPIQTDESSSSSSSHGEPVEQVDPDHLPRAHS